MNINRKYKIDINRNTKSMSIHKTNIYLKNYSKHGKDFWWK